jgi:hypothetical protein
MRNMIVVTTVVFCFAAAAFAVQPAPQKPDSLVKAKDSAVKVKDSAAVPVPAAPVAFGRITVTSAPAQAEVTVDSVVKGECPLSVDSLQQGTHVLIVKKKGYFGKKITVRVTADSTVTVAVNLVKPGRLILKSEPDQARVFLDGKEAGVTPYDNAAVKPGSHAVRCEKESFVPFEKQLFIAEGAEETLSVALSVKQEQPVEVKKAPAPANKSKFNTITTAVVAGLFAVFAIILFSIEIEETSK